MPFTYSQSTGELLQNGMSVGLGYSGAGTSSETGRNNPSMEGRAFQGPIPTGEYSIGGAHRHETKGPQVMRLTPINHDALGRNGFLIHGDNARNNASEGCIILGRELRDQIHRSGDTVIRVIP